MSWNDLNLIGLTQWDQANPVSDLENVTGAVAAWKLNEASGPIVDVVGGISLADQGGNTYSVNGSPGYNPGITTLIGGGFMKNSHSAVLDPGTGSFNLFVDMMYSNPSGNQRIYGTTNVAIGQPGFSLWSSSTQMTLEMLADDTVTGASVSWSYSENATLAAAVADSANAHTYTVQVNRSTNVANLYIDGVIVTIQDLDISSIGAANITGYRVAIGQEVRGSGINLGVKGTIYFVRQKNSLT